MGAIFWLRYYWYLVFCLLLLSCNSPAMPRAWPEPQLTLPPGTTGYNYGLLDRGETTGRVVHFIAFTNPMSHSELFDYAERCLKQKGYHKNFTSFLYPSGRGESSNFYHSYYLSADKTMVVEIKRHKESDVCSYKVVVVEHPRSLSITDAGEPL